MKEVAQVPAGGAVGLVDQDVDVVARVEVCRHVLQELADHGHDAATMSRL